MKKVLIDLSSLGSFCGFGTIAANYAREFSRINDPEMRFTFLVDKCYLGKFGTNVDYLEYHAGRKRLYRFFPMLLPDFDLWHSTHQFLKYRKTSGRCKAILTIHDLNFLYEKSPSSIRRHLNKLNRFIRHSGAVTAISEYTAQEMRTHLDMDGKDITVIHNAVEDCSRASEKQPGFVRTDKPFFFSVGQIRKKKNLHTLVDMMALLPDFNLYICGDDHFDYAKTVRQHMAANKAQNVYLAGKIDEEEKTWLYRHCAGFFFPSRLEGFGLPLLEAMLFGKPVFSSTCTSLPEIGGSHAIYWQNFAPDYMAQTVKDGLARFAAHPECAEQERAYAQTFNYKNHVEAYHQLYRKVLGLPYDVK